MQKDKLDINAILTAGISSFLRKIYQPMVDSHQHNFIQKYGDIAKDDQQLIANFFLVQINLSLKEMKKLHDIRDHHVELYYNAINIAQQEVIILQFCQQLGASSNQLKEDEKALKRWFDFEAVLGSYHEKLSVYERNVQFLLTQLRYVESKNSELLSLLLDMAEYLRVNDALAYAALQTILHIMINWDILPADNFAQQLAKYVLKESQDLQSYDKAQNLRGEKYINISAERTWSTATAFTIMAIIDQELFAKCCKQLFVNYTDSEHIFLREQVVLALVHIKKTSLFNELANLVMQDGSPYVRQGLCETLEQLPIEFSLPWLENIAFNDCNNAVRAKAFYTFTRLVLQNLDKNYFLQRATKMLQKERDPFALKVILKGSMQIALAVDKSKEASSHYLDLFTSIMHICMKGAFPASIHQQAVDNHLRLLIHSSQKLAASLEILQPLLQEMSLGKQYSIADPQLNKLTIDEFGQLMAFFARNDYDFEFWQQGECYILQRGVHKRLKLWRFLHELFMPSPSKRIFYSHTYARSYHGEYCAFSNMAELSETRVPGEPLHSSIDGARNFLPMLDYCLAVLINAKERKIYSAEGITTITPPTGLWRKIRAWCYISWNFRNIAASRNWKENTLWPANSYIKNLEYIGFKIIFNEYMAKYRMDYVYKFF